MLFSRKLLTVALASLALLAFASGAEAQATRTWVSGVGDDANPCSRTAPCKTFAGAISKTAAGGEISVLDPGGFGGVTITKSISIVAASDEGGVLVSGTNAIIINAGVNDNVTLRGLVIEGLGTGLNGVRFLAGASLHVENCTINSFSGFGIDFEPSGVSELYVLDTVVRNNNGGSGGGILVKPTLTGSAAVLVDNVRLDNNRFGLRAEDRSKVTVRNSAASGNQTNAFFSITVGGGNVEVNLENTTAANNGGAGVRSDGGATAIARVSNVMSVNNGNGLQAVAGGQIISHGNNRIQGNSNNGAPTTTLVPGQI